MEISDLKRDAKGIDEGKWVGDLSGMGDVRLRVRGLSSRTVITVRSTKERAVPRTQRHRDGSLRPDTAMRILGETVFEAVLLDWEGITDSGQPVSYDAELAKRWCTDPDYRFFLDAAVEAASIVDRGEADEREDVAKNSKSPSRGKSPTAE